MKWAVLKEINKIKNGRGFKWCENFGYERSTEGCGSRWEIRRHSREILSAERVEEVEVKGKITVEEDRKRKENVRENV